jgi:hypothetical protein
LTDILTATGFDMNKSIEYTPDTSFELLHSVRRYVKETVQEQIPVSVHGRDVYYSVNNLGGGDFVVYVYNPSFERWNGSLVLKEHEFTIEEVKGPWSSGSSQAGNSISLASNDMAVFKLSTIREGVEV